MKYIILIFIIVGILNACDTIDKGYNSGISNGKHDCSMLEYLRSNSYNWDSTVLMIHKAGLESLFEGKEQDMSMITFWGPTNHSIRRFMLQHNVERVNDMSVEFCKKVILMHVMNGATKKDEINFRIPNSEGSIEGASLFTTVGGIKLKAYKEQGTWGDVENAGAIELFLLSETAGDRQIPLASPDIETLSGIVHSLNYNYTIGDMMPKEDFEKLVQDLM